MLENEECDWHLALYKKRIGMLLCLIHLMCQGPEFKNKEKDTSQNCTRQPKALHFRATRSAALNQMTCRFLVFRDDQ